MLHIFGLNIKNHIYYTYQASKIKIQITWRDWSACVDCAQLWPRDNSPKIIFMRREHSHCYSMAYEQDGLHILGMKCLRITSVVIKLG